MAEPAHDVYEIELREASFWKRWLRSIGILLENVTFIGPAPANPGGRTIRVRRRATSAVVFEHVEAFGEDDAEILGTISADLETMTADRFATKWLS